MTKKRKWLLAAAGLLGLLVVVVAIAGATGNGQRAEVKEAPTPTATPTLCENMAAELADAQARWKDDRQIIDDIAKMTGATQQAVWNTFEMCGLTTN